MLTQREVDLELTAGRLARWAGDAYRALREKVGDPEFPCTFGTVALKKGDLLVGFVESDTDDAIVAALVALLSDYARFILGQPIVTASMMPLAIFMKPRPDCATVEAYFTVSWKLLQQVHERDPEPWPARVPPDPEDPRWSFCFGGVPFFINFKTPLHRDRNSRRVDHTYLWLVQARDGFDIVAGDTPQGNHARNLIRDKLTRYDRISPYPALAHYGQPDNREWKQYFVPESNEAPADRCPFRTRPADG
jgi:FPC/CPF motif-containing protein YcgG